MDQSGVTVGKDSLINLFIVLDRPNWVAAL
jgi:hypothetical protein